MFNWLKSLFKMPEPAGPPEEIKSYTPADQTIARDNITVDGESWKIEINREASVPMFELPIVSGIENCMLTYRAQMKAENLSGKAYLEMWCRLPGKGEFFSKGLKNPLTGTTGWAEYEVPFYLKKGQQPDLLKLNVFGKGQGTIQIKDIKVLKTSFK